MENCFRNCILCNTEVHDFDNLKKNMILDLVCVNLGKDQQFEKFLIYVNTIINYAIWKERNAVKFNFKKFSLSDVIQKII